MTEYDQEQRDRDMLELGEEKGIAKGIATTEERIAKLAIAMKDDGATDELVVKMSMDKAFRDSMFEKFHI